MKNSKNISGILLIFILVNSLNCCSGSKLPKVKAEIRDKTYKFEVAATSEARKTGLMFRKKLLKNSGMLFVYSRPLVLYFYMKNTLIPLDIAFIDSEYKIIDIQEMQPLDETTVMSGGEAQYALEANRGFFKRVGLKAGDKIQFTSPIKYID
jgi:uncharacterized membrane protein (UPF0127 family)